MKKKLTQTLPLITLEILILLGLIITSAYWTSVTVNGVEVSPGRDLWVIKTDENGSQQWQQSYGGNEDDLGYDITQTLDGGYAVAGFTKSSGNGDSDMWLIKTDENGTRQWDQTYGGQLADGGYALAATIDGGFVVAGFKRLASNTDMWLVKTDENGSVEWDQTYGGQGDEIAYSLVQTMDGGFAFAGFTHSIGGGDGDILMIKTDESGEVQWSEIYGGEMDEVAFALVPTADAGFALAGYTNSFGKGNSDVWLIKVDNIGEMQWNLTFGSDRDDLAYDLVQTQDGGFGLAGQKIEFNEDLEVEIAYWWLIKTNEDGTLQWESSFYGDPHHYGPIGDAAYSLIQTQDGGFALAGQRGAFEEEFDADMWLLKTDALGNHEWDRPPGSSQTNTARFLIQTTDGGFAYGGFKNPFGAENMAIPYPGEEADSEQPFNIPREAIVGILLLIIVVGYLYYRGRKIKKLRELVSKLYPTYNK